MHERPLDRDSRLAVYRPTVYSQTVATRQERVPPERIPEAVWRLQPVPPEIFQVLLALADEARHGYGIVKAIEAATDGALVVSPSPLYRKLKRLMELGVIAETDKRPAPDLDDERRRYYRLTHAGRGLLAAEARRLVRLGEDARIRRLAEAAPGAGDA